MSATVGGGLVEVTANGALELVARARIDHAGRRPRATSRCSQDLARAAANQALARAQQTGSRGDAAASPASCSCRSRSEAARRERTRPEPIERLVKALRRLPGVGEKTATRLAFLPLLGRAGVVRAASSAEAIVRLRAGHAAAATSASTSTAQLAVRDLPRPTRAPRGAVRRGACRSRRRSRAPAASAAATTCWAGTIAPLDGDRGPESLRVEALVARIERGGIDEVILATNPNPKAKRRPLYVAERVARYGVTSTRASATACRSAATSSTIDPVTVRHVGRESPRLLVVARVHARVCLKVLRLHARRNVERDSALCPAEGL